MTTKAVSQLKETLNRLRNAIVCDTDRAMIEPHLREIIARFKADRPVKIVEVDNAHHSHTIKVQEQCICALKERLEQQTTLHNEAVSGLTFKVNELTRQLAMARPSLEGKTDDQLLGDLTHVIKMLEDRLNETIRRTSADGRSRLGFCVLFMAMAILHGALFVVVDTNNNDLDRKAAMRHISVSVRTAVRRTLDYYEVDFDEAEWIADALAHYDGTL